MCSGLLLGACSYSPSQQPVVGGDTEMDCRTVITEGRESITCTGEEKLSKNNAIKAASGARQRNRTADNRNIGFVRRGTYGYGSWCDYNPCTPGKWFEPPASGTVIRLRVGVNNR
ncbi:hypothetical protein ACFL6I_11530 [candidate division KSB1 bacterium]